MAAPEAMVPVSRREEEWDRIIKAKAAVWWEQSKKYASIAKAWVSEFLSADHVRGMCRSWGLHTVALYTAVITAYRMYTRVNGRIESESEYNEDWSTTISVLVYVMVCVPISVAYQITMAGNRSTSTRNECVVSAVLCALGCALLGVDFSVTGDAYMGTFIMVGCAGYAVLFVSNTIFALDFDDKLPARLVQHDKELRKARVAYTKMRISSASEAAAAAAAKKNSSRERVTLLPAPKTGLEPMTVSVPKNATLRELFTVVKQREEEEAEEAAAPPPPRSSLKQTAMKMIRGPRGTWFEMFLVNSRPPIVYVSAGIAVLVLIVLAALFFSTKFRIFRKTANDLDNVSDELKRFLSGASGSRRRRLEDFDFDDAIDILDSASHKLREIERDWNASWWSGAGVALIPMLFVASQIVPRFDKAAREVSSGANRREDGKSDDETQATVGAATALFGATVSIVAIGYLLMTFIVAVVVFVFANDELRNIWWSYRYYFYSYAISFVIKSYILQPYLFHKYASDGHFIKRHTPFMLCDIGWTAYNFIIGATVALLRACYYIIYVCAAVALLDETVLPGQFKSFDTAHKAFVATVWSHHRHHNPIVHVAAEALQDAPRRTRAAKRWHLAYTLVHNPVLKHYRHPEAPKPPPPQKESLMDKIAEVLVPHGAVPDEDKQDDDSAAVC